MRLFETEGVVLRRKKVNNMDSYLTLFTRELGRIEVYAKGANFPKNANNKGAQPFVYGLFTINGKKSFSLSSVEVTKNFYSIREDFNKMLRASYLARVLLEVLEERESQKALFELFINALSIIEKYPQLMEPTTLYFFGRFAHLMGIKPHVENCLVCGNEDAPYYEASEGGFFCEEHHPIGSRKRQDLRGILKEIDKKTLVQFLNHLKEQETKEYQMDLELHLGIHFKTLRKEFESYF